MIIGIIVTCIGFGLYGLRGDSVESEGGGYIAGLGLMILGASILVATINRPCWN